MITDSIAISLYALLTPVGAYFKVEISTPVILTTKVNPAMYLPKSYDKWYPSRVRLSPTNDVLAFWIEVPFGTTNSILELDSILAFTVSTIAWYIVNWSLLYLEKSPCVEFCW